MLTPTLWSFLGADHLHGDKVHRILYRAKRCFYPGYMGTASCTVNIMEDQGKVEM